MAAELELEQKAKHHYNTTCVVHKTAVFEAWQGQSHVHASLKKMDDLLSPCKGLFEKLPHQRARDELPPAVQLLQGCQQFEGLCQDAQLFIAKHAQLLVLQEGVEVSGLQEQDPPQLYSVLCGSITLLHGSASDPELPQLLRTARAAVEADEAATAEAQAQQQLCPPTAEAAAAGACDTTGDTHAPAATEPDDNATSPCTPAANAVNHTSTPFSTVPASSSGRSLSNSTHVTASCPIPGVWQRVMAAVIHGSRLQIQHSMDARASTHANAQSPYIPAGPAHALTSGAAAGGPQGMLRHSEPTPAVAPERESNLTLSTVEHGQSFCVVKFSCSSPAGDTMLLATKPPSICLAAAATPNSVAGVLAVSRPVYTEALRLHHEHHVNRTLDIICRIPAMRHSPLKELTRLAAHVKETTYSKGQPILRQGQEVSDIHFVLQGTVHLTYSAALAQAAARAAARSSSSGGMPLGAARHSSAGSAGGAAPANPAAAAAGPRASSAGRFSGLALALKLEQSCFDPPVVLATRGPGAVLGDDAVRDRRLAVGVVAAEDGVMTLHVSPQKFLAALDPLTLRLFSRLRQQQDDTLQSAITAAAAAAAALHLDQQHHPTDPHRLALLQDIFNSNIPTTLSRPDHSPTAAAAAHHEQQRPAWQSIRRTPLSPGSRDDSLSPRPGPQTARDARGSLSPKLAAKRQGRQRAGQGHGGGDAGLLADAEWEAQLPSGVQPEQCAGLLQTTSVRQLVEVIKDISAYRKLHFRATSASSAVITAHAATAAARAATASLAGSQGRNLLAAPAAVNPQVAAAAAAAAATAAAIAARGSDGSTSGNSHTELLESCCVAVLRVQVLPGQVPVGMATLSSVLDDVYSACGAVAYDEGLKVVRWGPGSFILLAPIDAGVPEVVGVECAADVLLTTAARLAGLMLRAEGGLPMVRLAAGMAHGSSFLDYEAGNFISAISGKAFMAAAKLCEAACNAPTWSLPSTPSTSQSVLLVSDGVAAYLQSGYSYSLHALGGSHMLLAARAALPVGPLATSSNSRASIGPQAARPTLGPGRHTVLGLGINTGLQPVTPAYVGPKTPSSRRRTTSAGGARVQMRRQIRRKFEAMASFLAGSGDALLPPPDFMLTQPPPPAQTALGAAGDGAGVLGSPGSGVGSGSMGTGRASTVGFAVSALAAAGTSSSSGHAAAGKDKPKLSISLEGAAGTGLEEGPPSVTSTGSKKTPLSVTPTVGNGGRGQAGKLAWGENSARAGAEQGSGRAVGGPAMGAGVSQQPGRTRHGSVPDIHSNKLAGHKAGVRHGSVAGIASRSSAAGAASHGHHPHAVHSLASSCGNQAGANSGGGDASSTGSSPVKLRQQVWQEVQAMRAAGTHGSVPGSVTAALAAARHSAAGLSSSGGWGSHRHGSVSYWGALGPSSTPPRPASPQGLGLLSASPNNSRPASPLLQLAAAEGSAAAAGLAAKASQLGGSGSIGSTAGGSSSSVFKWGSGISLLSLTGGVVSAPAGAQLGAAAASHAASSRPRTTLGVDKAVCFLTPRTQAAAAAAASPHGHASVGVAAAHSMGLQRLHEGAAQHSVHLTAIKAAHDSSSSGGSAGGAGVNTSDSGLAQQQQLVPQLTEAQQVRLVHSACKTLGSAAAAEAYVASLPPEAEMVNFSASGLVQLPSLHGLSQLTLLAASFKKLATLTGLIPASEDAIAECAAAAAAEAVDAHSKQLQRAARSTASSRPGTAGGGGGVPSGGFSAPNSRPGTAGSPSSTQGGAAVGQLWGSTHHQQQHAGAAGSNTLQRLTSYRSLDASSKLQSMYDVAYEQHAQQLRQLLVPNAVSALPAGLLQLQLAHNQLVAVPFELPAALPALTMLDLSHNRLQELPVTLGALTDLKALYVGHNQLVQLPGSISRLQQLHTLHAEHNTLSHLLTGLPHLTSLSSLHLQHNSLQLLPEGLGQLTGLSSLGLGYNNLQQLPQGLLAGMSCLRQLDLSGNVLEDAALQQATEAAAAAAPGGHANGVASQASSRPVSPPLDSSRQKKNKPEVPASPAAAVERPLMPHLVFLDVSCNALQQLPCWLPPSLIWLSAGHNSISEVPAALLTHLAGSLSGLELSDNQLSALPTELKGLSKLQMLALDGNPGMHPDVADKGAGLSWAYRWLAERKQAGASAAIKAHQRHRHF